MINLIKNLLPTSCDWCPLNCGANRSEGVAGLCGADDKLFVARCSLHYWEEPPISGTIGGPQRGLGPGSGTIFFSNCNMKCVYCQNFEISGIASSTKGKAISLDTLKDMMLDLQNQGALNINFVTGTHYRSHIISAVRTAKNSGLEIPIVWNTSGYESLASVYALNDTIDVWLPDFKYASNTLAQKFSGNKITNYVETAMDALDGMLSLQPKAKFDKCGENIRMTNGVIVRHMILPGHIENSKAVLELLFENFGNEIKYSIMNQYTPVIDKDIAKLNNCEELLCPVSVDEYEEVLNFADNLGIEDYYWQKGETCQTSFIPQWD